MPSALCDRLLELVEVHVRAEQPRAVARRRRARRASSSAAAENDDLRLEQPHLRRGDPAPLGDDEVAQGEGGRARARLARLSRPAGRRSTPMPSATWSATSPAVSAAAASTGSKTSRAASRRTSLASSRGTASPAPLCDRRLEQVQRRLVVREDLADRVDVVRARGRARTSRPAARRRARPRSPRGRAPPSPAARTAPAPRRARRSSARARRGSASVTCSERITRCTAALPCRRWSWRIACARCARVGLAQRLDRARVERPLLLRTASASRSSLAPRRSSGRRRASCHSAPGSARGSARSRPRASAGPACRTPARRRGRGGASRSRRRRRRPGTRPTASSS